MSEAEDTSRTDETTSSKYEDDRRLLEKKKQPNLFKKNRNDQSNPKHNIRETNFLSKWYHKRDANSVNIIDAEQSTNTNEVIERNSDVDLIEPEVPEDSKTARCGCFGKMFRYLKRKLFKKKTSSPVTKRARLTDEETRSNATSSSIQHTNQINCECEAVDVQRTSHIVFEPQSINHEDRPPSQSVENGEIITSNLIDEVQQSKQPRKRIRKKKSKNGIDDDISEMPEEIRNDPKLKKYWKNRYRLFSKYDEGIKLDAESWYSVTPEKISEEIARRCQCDVIIDAFCGAGGNTIQFAFLCERVIAIDIDAEKIKLAKHNASIYGIADRIEFIVGDFFQVAPSLTADVVFLSPPWGGPSYNAVLEFPLNQIMEPYGGEHLYNVAKQITNHVAYFLPRNINVPEIAALEPDDYVKIDKNYLDNRLVAITAYFGDLVEDYGDEWND